MYIPSNEREKKAKILFDTASTPVDRAVNLTRFFLSMMMKQPVSIQGTNSVGQDQTCFDIVTGIQAEDGSHTGFIITTRTNGNYYVKA